jgi:hypothetical protein
VRTQAREALSTHTHPAPRRFNARPPPLPRRYSSSFPATSGLGNELHPSLSPSASLLAYSATYSGERDLYLLPLSATSPPAGAAPPLRLTYGLHVSAVLSWSSPTSLLLTARSSSPARPGTTCYELSLPAAPGAHAEVEPLPLARCVEATPESPASGCR